RRKDAIVRSGATESMTIRSNTGATPAQLAIAAVTFAFTLIIRVHGINTHFWLLDDQIRDWSIALRPLSELPLVGPPTHVHGYTIGPAFYWILWAIRVLVGPWFQNLPHAGGIGQAILQSGADTLLLVAVWQRIGSPWTALATVLLVATAAYDLALSALIWNPVAGSTLSKIATAMVLLDWYDRPWRVAVIAAVAWFAVQAYTGAIFVAVGVFTALVIDPIMQRDRTTAYRTAIVIAVVIAVLQVPYAVHQVSTRFRDSAMDAVTGSVARIAAGADRPQFAESIGAYVRAFSNLLIAPWPVVPFAGWLLSGCA